MEIPLFKKFYRTLVKLKYFLSYNSQSLKIIYQFTWNIVILIFVHY